MGLQNEMNCAIYNNMYEFGIRILCGLKSEKCILIRMENQRPLMKYSIQMGLTIAEDNLLRPLMKIDGRIMMISISSLNIGFEIKC